MSTILAKKIYLGLLKIISDNGEAYSHWYISVAYNNSDISLIIAEIDKEIIGIYKL